MKRVTLLVPAALTVCAFSVSASAQDEASNGGTTAPAAAPADADKVEAQPTKPPENTLGFEGSLGAALRIGSISSGLDAAERAGIQYGVGAYISRSRLLAFGLSYNYVRFGAEQTSPTVLDQTEHIRRTLHLPMLNLRVYPARNDKIGMWLGLGVGLSLQTAYASGPERNPVSGSPSKSYSTSAGPDTGLALGANLGLDYDISRHLAFLFSVGFQHHFLSSDPMGSASHTVPGIGSASQLGANVAFQYRFDTSASSPASASTQTASR